VTQTKPDVREDGRIVAWKANAGPQTAFVECDVPDVFYGGARGGGKTDALIGDFLGHGAKYGANARGILFRKSLPELEEVIRRTREIYLPLGWKYREMKHEWLAPNGATLRLAYLEHDADADHYQGHQYTWMAFDELGNWASPAPIDRLWASLRSAAGVPCVRRSTGNPGGPGHAWVKKRYIDDGPYNVRRFYPITGRQDIFIEHVFIPSTLDDNPKLRENDPTYEARLASAGSTELFRAWRHGDWEVLAGQYFDLFNPVDHCLRAGEYAIEPWHPKWIGMDWGYKDHSAIYWDRSDERQEVVTYRELYVNGQTPEDLGRMIARKMKPSERLDDFFLSRDAFDKRHSERTIADELYDGISRECAIIAAETGVAPHIPRPTRCDTDRKGGWMLMYQMLKNGTWKIDYDACPNLVECLPLMIRDPKDIEDVLESDFDHAPDAARYSLKSRLRSNFDAKQDERIARAAQIPDFTQRNIALLAANAEAKRRGTGVRLRRYR
jgi:hypothetical protein